MSGLDDVSVCFFAGQGTLRREHQSSKASYFFPSRLFTVQLSRL
uniref:Uncharacterized protein n=1 Tax=Pygocentrus nattereri TaxID=42514 RepID=A0AAR2J2V5_PYGNA